MNKDTKLDFWYIAYTRSRCENKAAQRAQELGLKTFLPLVEQERRWSDRIKKIMAPLFPNYIFIKPDSARIHQYRQIKEIVNLIRFENKFAQIKDSQIEHIKLLLEQQTPIVAEPRLYKKGAKVRIKYGAFVGMEGLLINKNKKDRFIIQLETLGHSIFVDVPRSYLAYF